MQQAKVRYKQCLISDVRSRRQGSPMNLEDGERRKINLFSARFTPHNDTTIEAFHAVVIALRGVAIFDIRFVVRSLSVREKYMKNKMGAVSLDFSNARPINSPRTPSQHCNTR